MNTEGYVVQGKGERGERKHYGTKYICIPTHKKDEENIGGFDQSQKVQRERKYL